MRYGTKELSRDDIGRIVMETSQEVANGYRRNISQFNTAHENEQSERCACAASNTGYFLLGSLGFSEDERKALLDTYKRS